MPATALDPTGLQRLELSACDARWLAQALQALPSRRPGGKPIIWAGGHTIAWLRYPETVEQLVRTTGSVPVQIKPGPVPRRWYGRAAALARKHDALVTAIVLPLGYYWSRNIRREPAAWHGSPPPRPGSQELASRICWNYRSRALQQDLNRMRQALLRARHDGLKVDYFYVDVEALSGSQSAAVARRRADYQRCPRCKGLAGHDRAVLAVRREIRTIIAELYPNAKQAWYNLGWTMQNRRLIPQSAITQFWPQDLEVADLAAPSFYFDGDRAAYELALAALVEKMPAGKLLAPTISTCFASYPRAGWQDWDPTITAQVVAAYLRDPRIAAICVFPCLLAPSRSQPNRHLVANRHLYAVAWAACRN